MNRLSTHIQSLRTPDKLFNASYLLSWLMMALLPFTTYFMWPIGILLTVIWIAKWDWREKWQNFKANDGIPYGIFLLLICLIPLFGLLNSDNQPYAWRTVECYLWFFIAPAILLTLPRNLLTKRHIHVLLGTFAASVFLHILILFAHGIFMTASTGDNSYLYYSTFSFLRHPTYVAIYTSFAYILIFLYLFENHFTIPAARKIPLYVAAAILLLGIFCLYSRAGILTFIVIHLVLSVYVVNRRRSAWKTMLCILSVIVGMFILLMTTSIAPENRFLESKYTMEQEDNDPKPVDARIVLWTAAWRAAVDNLPFGTGTGDCFEATREKYREMGYWVDFEHNYNAHNQYLQSLLTNGIPGIILLLLYFFTPFGEAIRHKDFLLFSVFILLAMNSCVECVFDRRFGVDFFAVMIPLLMMRCMTYDA